MLDKCFLPMYNVEEITKHIVCLSGLVLTQRGSILPLHLAVCYRKVKSMKSLLSAGADPEER